MSSLPFSRCPPGRLGRIRTKANPSPSPNPNPNPNPRALSTNTSESNGTSHNKNVNGNLNKNGSDRDAVKGGAANSGDDGERLARVAMQHHLHRAAVSRHLQREVSTMLGYPVLIEPNDPKYWRMVMRDVEATVADQWFSVYDALSAIQSPPDDQSKRMNYDDYQKLREECHPVYRRLMSASTFLKFKRDKYGRISNDALARHMYSGQHLAIRYLDLTYYSLATPQSTKASSTILNTNATTNSNGSNSENVPPTDNANVMDVSSAGTGSLTGKRYLSEEELTQWVRAQLSLAHETHCPDKLVPNVTEVYDNANGSGPTHPGGSRYRHGST